MTYESTKFFEAAKTTMLNSEAKETEIKAFKARETEVRTVQQLCDNLNDQLVTRHLLSPENSKLNNVLVETTKRAAEILFRNELLGVTLAPVTSMVIGDKLITAVAHNNYIDSVQVEELDDIEKIVDDLSTKLIDYYCDILALGNKVLIYNMILPSKVDPADESKIQFVTRYAKHFYHKNNDNNS